MRAKEFRQLFRAGECPPAREIVGNGECPQATEIAMASVDMHAF